MMNMQSHTPPKPKLAKLKLGLSLAATLLMAGCMQTTLSPSTDASMTPRDRQQLANPPYAEIKVPDQYQRHVVDYDRPEPPNTILVDSDNHYLYYVLPDHKALRYGVAVGEEAMAFSGTATVGKKAEWPDWVPTPGEQARLGPFPKRVAGGAANPLGARALYLYQGDRDILFRIHGTNEPWTIGTNVSSGCIRMVNQDVIDLYQRTPVGAKVVVLGSAGRAATSMSAAPTTTGTSARPPGTRQRR
jgi:lipoprotein-anchoring transpeptidase ErfK/SrfK